MFLAQPEVMQFLNERSYKEKKKNINGSLEWLVDKRETSGLFKMKQGIKVYSNDRFRCSTGKAHKASSNAPLKGIGTQAIAIIWSEYVDKR